MDTASLIDMVTSVDLGSLTAPLTLFNDAVNAVFNVVGGAIAVWPAGSTAVAGSIEAGLGSLGGLI